MAFLFKNGQIRIWQCYGQDKRIKNLPKHFFIAIVNSSNRGWASDWLDVEAKEKRANSHSVNFYFGIP
jgi:hypothetical protein